MSLSRSSAGGVRKLVIVCLTAVILAGVIGWELLWNHSPPEPSRAVDDALVFLPAPVTFAPGIHMLGALSPSVAYVVETSDGLVLVDTGLEDGHELLLRQLEKLGLDVRRLKIILVTHGHGDHYLGAMKLKELTGARIYAGKGDSEVLRMAGPRDAVFSTFPMDRIGIHPTTVDRELVGGERLEIGDTQVQVIATPGHTPGSVCYFLERDGRSALFSGDTIMSITGDLGTYATYLPPRYRGDAQAYLNSFQELAKRPVPDLLLPGHPHSGDSPASPRLTAREWQSMLRKGIQEMNALVRRYEVDGADFLDGNPKELLEDLHYLGEIAGTAIYGLADRGGLVLFDAPEDGHLDELRIRIERAGLDLSRLKAVVVTSSWSGRSSLLAELVETTGCTVVAHPADVPNVSKAIASATVIAPDEFLLPEGGPVMNTILVEGLREPRLAFAVQWKDKQVLFTGDIPLKLTLSNVRKIEHLRFGDAVELDGYVKSLAALHRLKPDLWLPAHPVNGQNANLYGSDWSTLLRESRMVIDAWQQ